MNLNYKWLQRIWRNSEYKHIWRMSQTCHELWTIPKKRGSRRLTNV